MNLNRYCFLISQNISADLKGPKIRYKLHYGRCKGPLFRDATRHNTGFESGIWLLQFLFIALKTYYFPRDLDSIFLYHGILCRNICCIVNKVTGIIIILFPNLLLKGFMRYVLIVYTRISAIIYT